MSPTARKWLAVVLVVGSASIVGLGMRLASRPRVADRTPDEVSVILPVPALASKPAIEGPRLQPAPRLAVPNVLVGDTGPKPQSEFVHPRLRDRVTPQLKQAVDELSQASSSSEAVR